MLWGDGNPVKNPTGSDYGTDKQIKDGVKEQKADEYSLYTYYKKLIMIRKANPAIARGEYKAVSIEGSKAGGFTSTLDGTTVLVLHNPSRGPQTIDLSAIGEFASLRAVVGVGAAELEGGKLYLDGQTSVVLG